MSARGTKARFALALGALLGFGGTALAQDELPHVISPLTVVSDQNGVNLIDGKLRISTPTLSIPAAPHLVFDGISNAAPYITGVSVAGGESTATSTWSIHAGTGASDSFRCVEADCTSVTGSGSTFRWGTNKYRQSGSAAEWTFNVVYGVTSASGHTNSQYYAGIVRYPNGETITYTYDTATLTGDTLGRSFRRPNRIESNLGYAITITYQGGDLNADPAAWAAPAQVTLAPSAAGSPAIAWLTYSGDSVTLHGQGESSGRTFHCTGCNLHLGDELEVPGGSLQLPTEGAASTSIAPVSGEQLVGSVTRDGVGWSYAYDNIQHQVYSLDILYDHLTVTGPNSFHNVYTYAHPWVSLHSRRQVLTAVTDSIGRTTTYGNDEYFRPVSMTMPGGNQVAIGYDPFGNLIWRTTTPAGGGTALTESVSYPTDTCTSAGTPILCYRPTWSRDAMGRQTDYGYNSLGQLTEQLDPADANGVRRRTTIVYALSTNGISRRTAVRVCADTGASCTTSAPIQTEYDYAAANLPVDTLLPSAERRIDVATATTLTTNYGYDSAGRLTSTDGPLSTSDDAIYTRYDPWGRKTWAIAALGANGQRTATRTTYRDADDKVTATEAGTLPDANSTSLTVISRTDLTYDAHRNPIRAAVTAGGTVQAVTDKAYDDSGRLVCTAIRMNPAQFGSSPGACALTTTNPALGPDRITVNSYDAAGQMLQEIRAYQITTANAFPQTLQQNYVTYTYTANGQRATVTDANGNMASMTYDGFDRQIRWNSPSPTMVGTVSSTDYEAYTYDGAGNRLSLRKRDGTTLTYSYDNLNRLLVKTVPTSASGAAGYSVYFGYDLRNAQLYARFGSASGAGITNTYDGFGRLATTITNLDGTNRMITYTLDPHGNHIGVTGNFGYYTGYTFDAADRGLTVADGGGTVLRMTFDSAGRPSRLDSGASPTNSASVTYDAMGRIATLSHDLANSASDQSFAYAYNAASQMTTRTSSNDAFASNTAYAVNRNYSVNGLNQYIAAGTATFGYDANGNLTSDGSRTFTYDAENRLVAASGGVALAYDPLGRLWQVASPSGTTRFVYDGDALIWEMDGAGNARQAYVHGPNASADDPLIWYDGAAGFARRFLHADHQGSIIATADDSGNMVAINAYDAWGIPNAGNVGRFQYTGQAWIPELGMYYYKARIYSPTLGRFMQTDPVGYKDQMNLYAYVGDDPINHTDPTGLWTCGANSDAQCNAVAAALRQARRALQTMHGPEAARLRRAIQAFGARGVDNHVVVAAGAITRAAETSTVDGTTTVTINSDIHNVGELQRASIGSAGGAIAHEGQHISDERTLLGGRNPRTRQESYDTERRAYAVQGETDRALGVASQGGYPLWMPNWRGNGEEQRMRQGASDNAWITACRGTLQCNVQPW